MTVKEVILTRGIPGSGKSTYIRENYPSALVCSADHFFVDKQGVYNFNPKMLGCAHGSCKRKFEKSLLKGVPSVVVDNTNMQWKEYGPYLKLAKKHGYAITVVRFVVPVDVAFGRNSHGVPLEVIQGMSDRMDDIPDKYTELIVETT